MSTERLTCRQCHNTWRILTTDCLIVDMPDGARRIWFPCRQCNLPEISPCPNRLAARALSGGAHHHDWRHLTKTQADRLEVDLWNTLTVDLGPDLRYTLSTILKREVS